VGRPRASEERELGLHSLRAQGGDGAGGEAPFTADAIASESIFARSTASQFRFY